MSLMVTGVMARASASVVPPNGNPGTVPPYLQYPIHILPMPDGWEPDEEGTGKQDMPVPPRQVP